MVDARLRLVLLIVAIGWLVLEVGPPGPQVDDAYISYRYARNLVAGQGLVFNPGEHVEGFTNLLWTLGVAAGLQAGLDAPLAGHWLGASAAVATLLLVYGLARPRDGGRTAVAGLAALALPLSPAFVYWATSGLETPLFCAAVAGAFLAQRHRRPELAFAACAVATATRPEGVLLAGCVALVEVLPRHGGLRTSLLRGAALYGVCLIALTAFRLLYYGDVVPNTFHAKVGGIPVSRGLDYAAGFLLSGAGLVLLAAAPTLRAREAWVRSVWLWTALDLAYVVAIGGDVFPLHRFLLPVYGPVVALAARAAATARASAAASGLAVLLVAGVLWGALGSGDRRTAREHTALARMLERLHRERMERVERYAPWARSIAAGAIGVQGYYTDAIVIDYLGLTDPVVARSPGVHRAIGDLPGHRRANFAYVLEREPDLIFVPEAREARPSEDDDDDPQIDAITDHAAFGHDYRYDERIPAYVRKRAVRRRGGAGDAGRGAGAQSPKALRQVRRRPAPPRRPPLSSS